jgi:two-component system, chemotaxis family, protein-glutamate methylesterase/glutaminase
MVQRPCPVVMVSALTAAGAETTLAALRLGAVDFVAKPTGAVSLRIDEFAPVLKEKIRSASTARLPASHRLKERVQLRTAKPSPALRSRLDEAPEPVAGPMPGEGVVLVGTSTGGPPALEALLLPLRSSFPWPIVVAQHMPASFTGALARRLDGICALTVLEASGPMPLQPGHVYIGRGDADVVLSRRTAGLLVLPVPPKATYPWHPSTERLVRSALDLMPASHLIGVLMTGMGNDGAAAMTELKTRGGRTIAESEETAVVWGMPGELVKAGGDTWVAPLPGIAKRLEGLVPVHASRP